MTRTVVTAEEHTDLREIARLMQRHRVRRVPIVHDGKVVGMISRANLLRGLSSREPFPVDGRDQRREHQGSRLGRARNDPARIDDVRGVGSYWSRTYGRMKA